MKIKIYRVDKSLPLPTYKTPGSVAFDVYSRIDAVIKPKEIGYLPTNFIIKVPEGYVLMVAARSSTHKMGLMVANGVAWLDQDFYGPEDEPWVIAYNYTNKDVRISKGDRVAQAAFIPVTKVSWQEVKAPVKKTSRGMIGSTGVK